MWDRFGDVPNFIEPFFGSGAVLLGRPQQFMPPGIETVNDKDAYLVNFWRSLQADPESTAKWADWPVSEADLLARHRWLAATGADRLLQLRTDPDYYDAKVAGWWVWGLCSWIGDGWCRERGDGHQPEATAPRGRGDGHQPEATAPRGRGEGHDDSGVFRGAIWTPAGSTYMPRRMGSRAWRVGNHQARIDRRIS